MKIVSASRAGTGSLTGSFSRTSHKLQVWALLAALAFLAGCGQGDIRVYRVAKEAPQPELTAQADAGAVPPGHPDVPSAAPGLTWKLPPSWEEVAPGEMRVASFRIKGQSGQQADVSIVPLPGMAGGEINNVNRWRGQVGQPPVTEAELAQLAQPVQIAGQPARLYEQAGKAPNSDEESRILAVIQRRDGTAWFFKMTGNDTLVKDQKPAFIDFLKSLSFSAATARTDLPPSHPPIDAGAPPQSHPASTSSADEGKPKWQVPPGWRETAGGEMLIAKFLVAGPEKAQAAVNVSALSGDGGGLAANVNRWRRQLSLQPLADSEVEKQVQPLELASGKAMLVDMSGADARTGQKTRLVGAIVPQASQTWFYKLMGSEALVEREKAAFTKFVQTAKYP